MKHIIVIYSLFILVFSSYGQNNEIVNKYHNNLNLSYDLMAEDNYHEALSVMNETMRLGLGYGDDAYVPGKNDHVCGGGGGGGVYARILVFAVCHSPYYFRPPAVE